MVILKGGTERGGGGWSEEGPTLCEDDRRKGLGHPRCFQDLRRDYPPFHVPQHLPLFGREMTVPPMLDFPLARKRRHFVQRAHSVQHFAPRCGRSRLRRGRTKRRHAGPHAGYDHAIRARRTVGIRRRRPGIHRCGLRRRVVPVVGPVVSVIGPATGPVIGGAGRRARRRSIPVPVVPVWIVWIRVARRRIGGRRDVVRIAVGIIAGRVIRRRPRVVPISVGIRVSGPTPIRPAEAEAPVPTPAPSSPTPTASAKAPAAAEAVTSKAAAERSTAKSCPSAKSRSSAERAATKSAAAAESRSAPEAAPASTAEPTTSVKSSTPAVEPASTAMETASATMAAAALGECRRRHTKNHERNNCNEKCGCNENYRQGLLHFSPSNPTTRDCLAGTNFRRRHLAAHLPPHLTPAPRFEPRSSRRKSTLSGKICFSTAIVIPSEARNLLLLGFGLRWHLCSFTAP